MIDIRIHKLLREYYAVRKNPSTQQQKILVHKYNNVFHELKYKFNKLFSLGPENYTVEFDDLLDDISKREKVLIAILEELIASSG